MILYLILLWGAATLVSAQKCPNQWAPYQTQCFRFVYNSKLPWRDARDFCRLHGGDLLKIQTVAQRNWVVNRARSLANSRKIQSIWWTGLNNLEMLTAWEWADGTPVDSTLINWSPGQPNNWRNTQRCADIWTNSRINDESCDINRNFICSRNRGDPVLCDADRAWQTLNGQCYKVYGYQTSWLGAQRRCVRDGGSLVTIDSPTLESTIHDLAVTAKQPLWLGLHSIKLDASSAYWMWIPNNANTSILMSVGYWQANKPPVIDRARLNTTCVVMSNLGNPQTAWYPQYCGSVRAFVCQKPEGMCFPGWIGHRSNCYQFNPHFRLGFNGAASFCQGQGAELIRIAASSDQQFLNSYLQEMTDSGSSSFWIGLSDNNNDAGPYKWRNNRTVTSRTYKNWATANNFPTNAPGKTDCVYINTNDNKGKWQITQSCQSAKSFICTVPMGTSVTSPASTPTPVFGCPTGWKLHSGFCFLVVNTPSDAFTARQTCQTTPGADLAKITSADIQAFVNGFVDTSKQAYYIGLNDLHSNNVFMWNDETIVPTNYTNWKKNQPNDYNHQESCVVITNQLWNDMACSYKLPFICSMLALSPFIPPVPTPQTDWTVKCGIGWESNPLTDSCYMFSDEPLEWTDARLECQVYGGDLVSIGGPSEQNYLAGRLLSMKSLVVWTGANDRKSEQGWNWISGEGFAFLNWAAGQPGGDKGEGTDCVAMLTTTAKWDDIDCISRNGYVCEKKGNVPTTASAVTSTLKAPAGMQIGCLQGWLPFENNCYLIQTRSITWDFAATVCARKKARLASVLNSDEQNFLVANIPKSNTSTFGFWIGLNDKQTDNNFQWMDGSPVTYTNWRNGEPNNWMNWNEDCVLILQKTGLWNDAVCSNPFQGLVCQRPKGIVSVTQSPYRQGCPTNTQGYGPYCYWVVGGQPLGWTDANAKCNSSFKGALATVNDRYLEAFLSTRMVKRSGNFWIGLSDMANPGTYKWIDGTEVAYTNWDRNHTGNEKSKCVAMRANIPIGFWDNLDCTQKNNFICQFGRQGYTTPPTPGTPWANVPCPPGWATFQGFCYKLFCNSTLNWMSAVEHCQNMGGDLPSVHSKDQDTFLVNYTTPCGAKFYWFGMNDRDIEGGMKWTDGSPIDYTNWHQDEPNNWYGIEDCGTFSITGYKWNDYNCYSPLSYVCALPRGTQPRTTPVPPTGVATFQCGFDANWIFFNGSCYIPSPTSGANATLSWYDASAFCSSYSSTLASVHTNREMEFLQGTFGFQNAWIGLNILQGTAYQWSDGTPVDYSNWNSNEPNNYGGVENCVHFNKKGKWNDNLCQGNMKFVCKKPVNGVATRAVPSPNPPGGCSNGFTPVPGGRNKCFYIGGTTGNSLRNFSSARAFCRAFGPGYDLISIEDQFEQEFLMTMTYNYNTSFWIGLSDNRGNNQFYWQSGAPLIYTNWETNSPRSAVENNKNKNLQNCVIMFNSWKGHQGKWQDISCQRAYAFVCQAKQDPSVPVIPTVSSCTNPLYKSFRNTCYKVSSIAKTWNDAMTDCQADGGNLASVYDAVEMAYMITIAARNAPYWIGLSDAKVAGLYSWTDGWPVVYTRWGPGQPQFSQATGHGCVFYNSNGNWNDSDCSNIFNYLCKISSATPPPTIPPTSGNCTNANAVPNGDYCYYIGTSQSVSFPDASYACSKMGMQLASVHSMAEMNFIVALSQQFHLSVPMFKPTLWIGLTKGFNGAFKWSDGTSVNFLNWKLGEPSTIGFRGQIEECTEMDFYNGRWDDISCFFKRGYVCKTLKAFHSTQTPIPTYHYTVPQFPRQPVDPFTFPFPIVTRPQYHPQTQYIYTNRLYPPGRTNAPPPFIMPTNPYQPVVNTPQPQQQVGPQSKSSSGGMSGGGIAGIIIAVIIVLAVVALVVVYLRKTGKMNELKGVLGFDNALYKNEVEDIQL